MRDNIFLSGVLNELPNTELRKIFIPLSGENNGAGTTEPFSTTLKILLKNPQKKLIKLIREIS